MPGGNNNQLKVIVGLGNPGLEYKDNRHNAGFMIVDALSERLKGGMKEKSICNGILRQVRLGGIIFYLFKPMTFMNLSGTAIACLARKLKILPCELMLVYDDMDLPLGRIRLKKGGGSAGHNGVESTISELEDNGFARLRVGIGRSEAPGQVDHVLSGFIGKDKEIFDKVVNLAVDAVKLSFYRGLEKAMNEYNGCLLETEEDSDNKEEIGGL